MTRLPKTAMTSFPVTLCLVVIGGDGIARLVPESQVTRAKHTKSNMAIKETRQKRDDESDSDSEEDDVVEAIPKIDIDPSKLSPLSPEVISKQVSAGQLTTIMLICSE